MMEFNSVCNDLAFGITFNQLEAAIQFHGWPNVEAFLGTVVPRAPGGRLGMDKDATSHRSKRGLVEIKEAVEELSRRDWRVEGSLS